MRNVVILKAPHEPFYMDDVVEQMKVLGAPRIRAVWRGDHWQALEGSHRIAAARILCLLPRIVPMRLGDKFSHDVDEVLPDRRVSSILKAIDSWSPVWARPSYTFIGLPVPTRNRRQP